MRLDGGILELTVARPSPLTIEVFDVDGNLRQREQAPKAQPGVFRVDLAFRFRTHEVLIIQASIGPLVQAFRYNPQRKDFSGGPIKVAGPASGGGLLAKTAAAADTLRISAAGHSPEKTGLASLDATVDVRLEDFADTGGAPPRVTPKNARTVPAMYGNPVANPGKLTTNVTYSAYWDSTSATTADAFNSVPTIPRQNTPKSKFCNVYTPPGFDPQQSYPLIIIMHGITDNPNTWIERTNPGIATMFDNPIDSKATKPIIAVYASGTADNNTNA